jgi:molybdopterin/thiamine biosynthesis adenylyltransferase
MLNESITPLMPDETQPMTAFPDAAFSDAAFPDAVEPNWSYEDAFVRNRGLITDEGQHRLRNCRVAIAGMGGVGGIHLETLARLGIGQFTIADPDVFEVVNFNRQAGANCSTIGRSKVEVMAKIARQINPEVKLRTFNGPIDASNADEFLHDADLFIDAVDFFSLDLRRMLFRKAARRNIYAITAGPIGFSTAWLTFDPMGMSFDSYFDLHDDMDRLDGLIAFGVGLAPAATQMAYLDLQKVNINSRTGPSTAAACQLCAGVAAIDAVRILTGGDGIRTAPSYSQFDAYRHILRKGYLPWGNRHPWQRFKRWWLRKKFK